MQIIEPKRQRIWWVCRINSFMEINFIGYLVDNGYVCILYNFYKRL